MKAFKDTAGREWVVTVNIGQVKRVRSLLNIDLLADGWEKLRADPVKLVDVLFVLCKEQADKLPVTDEQFGSAMGGDALDNAQKAFEEAWADFSPSARRPAIRRAMEKMSEAEMIAGELVMKRIDSLDTAALITAAIDHSTLGKPSTNSPVSSASTPPTSPSGS